MFPFPLVAAAGSVTVTGEAAGIDMSFPNENRSAANRLRSAFLGEYTKRWCSEYTKHLLPLSIATTNQHISTSPFVRSPSPL